MLRLVTALLFVLLVLAPSAQSKQDWQWKYTTWMPGHWIRLAQCEGGTRGEPNWKHNSGTYQGAFGFHYTTWDQYKPFPWWPKEAFQATPWQQYQTALRVAARWGIAEPWGCWRGDDHAWVRGNVPYHARK